MLCLYLLYTFVQSLYDIRIAGDFYTELGLTPHSSEREIKARFRRLAARLHPDKLREGADSSPAVESTFVHLKLAQDTLLDPVKRFAYDRFGPAIVQVQHPGLKTARDYVYLGMRSLVPEYIKGAFTLALLNYFWLPKWGQYWRYLTILAIGFLELYFLTHVSEPPTPALFIATIASRAAHGLLPIHLLPFQILSVARRMSLSLNIFISQLATPAALSGVDENRQMQQQLAHLSQVAGRTDAEAGSLLSLGLAPFKGDGEKVETLRVGMKEGMVMNTIKSAPEVRAAVRKVLQRRKQRLQTEVSD